MAESQQRQPHLYAVSSLGMWWALIRTYGGISPKYFGRFAGIVALSLLTAPLRLAERVRYERQVSRTKIAGNPIYIQGFARTGTTHLHNLLSHDPNFGYVSTFQALSSPFFLISRGWLEGLISKRIPTRRPADNMAVALDLPQEEELALGAISRHSLMQLLSFPGRAEQIVEKYAAMELTETEMRQWERKYLEVLRKATLASRRRLVLKSPANLGRTLHLLRLFPGAKFIHIIRNPYDVFASMMNLYRKVIPLFQLQEADGDMIESVVFRHFDIAVRKYMRDRESIPKRQFIEIRYEDLVADGLGTLERIYAELSLPGWDQAREPIGEYLATLSGYQKNVFRFDQSQIDKVYREWGFAVREWGYEPPVAHG